MNQEMRDLIDHLDSDHRHPSAEAMVNDEGLTYDELLEWHDNVHTSDEEE